MELKSELKSNRDFQIVVVAVSFYAAACLGYFLAFEDTTALPAWPPSGIAFALILIFGRQAWPGITIGSLVSSLMAYWNDAAVPAQVLIALAGVTALAPKRHMKIATKRN